MKIFDAIVHPQKSEEDNLRIVSDLKSAGVFGALAIPLPGVESFDLKSFVMWCKKSELFYPISLFTLGKSIRDQVMHAKNYGCYGIKVHPRFLKWDWTKTSEEKILRELFSECKTFGLAILFCTYFSCDVSISPKRNPIYIFTKLLKEFPGVKIVMMHAGGHNILDYIEFSRFNENILLDLSFTILKFKDSSIDFDIKYALKNFDKRVCFGSDAPYYNPTEVSKRVKELLHEIDSRDEYINSHGVWSKNIINFLEIKNV